MSAAGRRLDWDSGFFGFPIGEANPATPEAVAAVDAWARQQEIRCVYLRGAAEHLHVVTTAERHAFFLTGVRLTCTLDAGRARSASERGAADTIRVAQPSDVTELERIASRSH